MLVHDLLRNSARLTPHRPYLITADEQASFGGIDRDSDCLAAALQDAGVGRGDRVVVMLENSAEMVIALWATLKAGAVFVPVHPATKEDKLRFVLTDSGARCLIAPVALAER